MPKFILEKRIKKIEVILIVLTVLVSIDIVSPWIPSIFTYDSVETNITEPTKELPKDITLDYLNEKVYNVKVGFNNADWEKIYNVFGEFAKAQIKIKDVEYEFQKLKDMIGEIQTYAYSHYIYEGNDNNADWFTIYYKSLFKNGKGTIKISTRTFNNQSDIIGINIVLEEE